MPELPEVETIKRGLMKCIIKQKITRVQVLCEKSFIGRPSDCENTTVTGLRRYGKALIIDLSNGHSLMIHLRMTGQLIFRGGGHHSQDPVEWAHSEQNFAGGHPSESFVDKLPNKQTRVIIEFNGSTLFFNDQRKFGFIKVLPTPEVQNDAFIKKLAPEPWSMNADDFYARLQRHGKSAVKAVILDQSIICGLGNIYADEALFAAQIHPERKAGSLSRAEATALLQAACEAMDHSIASGGSTMATYVKADGTRGDYLELFAQVFRREGQPCTRCGTKIIKTRVAGRGTHICPHCQKLTDNSTIEPAVKDAVGPNQEPTHD